MSVDRELEFESASGFGAFRHFYGSRTAQDVLNVTGVWWTSENPRHVGAFVPPTRANEQGVFDLVVRVHAVETVAVVGPVPVVQITSEAPVPGECLGEVERQVHGGLQ